MYGIPPGYNTQMTRPSYPAAKKVHKLCLNLFVAWCHWSDMVLRLDKCSSFGLVKRSNVFKQTFPGLFVEGKQVPSVAQGEDFCYLGKLYNFEINASAGAKEFITNKLKALLAVTNKLKVRPQTKLKILKLYIHAQIVFYLKAYDLSSTWIENALDAPCVQCVRDWLETPISSCVSEMKRSQQNGAWNTVVQRSSGES